MAGARSADNESPPDTATRLRRRRRLIRRAILLAFLFLWVSIGLWNSLKPLPEGVHVATAWADVPLSEVRLLVDSTVTDGQGRLVVRQEIFDEVMRMIDAAKEIVVLDFFLFNDHMGVVANGTGPHRELCRELKEHLLARKAAVPELRVLFVTDPINDVYGGAPSPVLEELRAAGIAVVSTDLDRLRDSNAGYSALWRMFVGWWDGDASGSGWLANPLETGPDRVTLRAWMRLLNFKANHRKLIVADDGKGGLAAVVTSANPHDASSAHSNLGLRFSGPLANELIASEIAVARFSGWSEPFAAPTVRPAADTTDAVRLQYLTEGAIKSELLNAITTTERGESISIAVFYLADRDILDALVDATTREVRVRLILDPNKDAFGRTKDGVPNRPVAAELVRRSGGRIEVRWYRTHGEQFHVKLAIVQRGGVLWALLGSANFTRRNLNDYNLEASVALETGHESTLAHEVSLYFDLLWQNDALALREYTTDFPTYEDQSFARYWRYRLMEATGLSTF